MKYSPCEQIACPAASVSEALRLCEVCTLPSQLLRQQFLLGNIHCRTDKTFENPLFDKGNSHRANVAQLPVRPNDPFYLIKATVFLLHAFDGFSHAGSVLRMDKGKILFNRRCAILRIKTVDFVQLIRPIMA